MARRSTPPSSEWRGRGRRKRRKWRRSGRRSGRRRRTPMGGSRPSTATVTGIAGTVARVEWCGRFLLPPGRGRGRRRGRSVPHFLVLCLGAAFRSTRNLDSHGDDFWSSFRLLLLLLLVTRWIHVHTSVWRPVAFSVQRENGPRFRGRFSLAEHSSTSLSWLAARCRALEEYWILGDDFRTTFRIQLSLLGSTVVTCVRQIKTV